MKTICAWHEKTPEGNTPVSHGICPACLEREEKNVKHTPMPWEVANSLSGKTYVTISHETPGMFRHQICEMIADIKVGDPEANAELIVRAVNSHEALLKAAKLAETVLKGESIYLAELTEAIALAEGKVQP